MLIRSVHQFISRSIKQLLKCSFKWSELKICGQEDMTYLITSQLSLLLPGPDIDKNSGNAKIIIFWPSAKIIKKTSK